MKRAVIVPAVFILTVSQGILQASDTAYLKTVRAYADAMIEHGRDVYGEVHSPLFVCTLDRHTMRIPEGETLKRIASIPRSQWGIRPADRTLTACNPMQDQNLYQVLYALSKITGEPRYAAEADKSLGWFLEHCASEATGLLPWGEHMAWDVITEKPIRDIHEFLRPWVLWDSCFRIAPRASERFALGLWRHQIHDRRTGAYSRHARYSSHRTSKGTEYPRHGGFYIRTWASAYSHTKMPLLLEAIEVLVDSFEQRRNPKTDAIPASSGSRGTLWPPSNLSLAIDLHDGASLAPEATAEKMLACAKRIDDVFLKCDHQLGPDGRGFVTRGNTDTLKPHGWIRGHFVRSQTWLSGYGDYTDAQMARFCVLRCDQTKRGEYLGLARAAADRYLHSDPDASIAVWPSAVGDAVGLLVEIHRLTGDRKYLARAKELAARAQAMFFTPGSPLPKATSNHDHYEAVTRADTLMMELLRLWAVVQQPPRELRHSSAGPDSFWA